MIETTNFKFEYFDLNNPKHIKMKEELIGNSKSKFVHQVEERIDASEDNTIFGNAFLVSCGDLPIGYLYISSMPRDYIFLEYLLISEVRGKGYGKNMLQEIEDYLFENYSRLKEIHLDIDNSNIASQTIAEYVGYYAEPDDLLSETKPHSMIFKKFNPYYRKTTKK